MAVKISQLPAAVASAAGDLFAVVQASVTRRVALSQITAWTIGTYLGFTSTATNAVARTVRSKDSDVVSVKDYGAIGDGSSHPLSLYFSTLAAAQAVYSCAIALTDELDWAAIQTAVNVLAGGAGAAGNALFFPATLNGSYYINRAINLPNQNAYTLYGEGRRSSKIYQATAGINAFTSSNVYASGYNGITFRNLWIAGNGGQYGIYWKSMSRSQAIDCSFTGWNVGGGTPGSAIRCKDTIELEVRGCYFAGNDYDITDESPSAGGATSNAWAITDSIFDGPGMQAINSVGFTAINIIGNSFQNYVSGAINIGVGQSVNITGGNYFEGNYNTTSVVAGSYDIFIGSSSYVTGCKISGNYHAGLSNTPGPTNPQNFYPLRIGYAIGLTVEANYVNTGTRWISFEGGANSVRNSTFGFTQMNDGDIVALSSSHQTYSGIYAGGSIAATPMQFIKNGNRITDYIAMPASEQNCFFGDMPYGNWTFSAAGASTFTRAPNSGTSPYIQNGRPVALCHSSTGGSVITNQQTVSTVVNSNLLGQWITFMMDVLVVDAASKNFHISLFDDLAVTYSHLAAGQTSTGWQTVAVSGIFVGSSTISARITFDDITDYYVANPRLYMGMDAATMPGISGPPYWATSSVPTTGTWTQGDLVWNSAPAAGGAPGWVCTTTGTGGGALVFKAMANLAA